MHVQQLGHVVLNVGDVERSEAFYAGVLGIPIAARIEGPIRLTLFTLGNHHDFGVVEVVAQAERTERAAPCDATVIGLGHVAFKVGSSAEELDDVRCDLEAAGIEIVREADRAFTSSVHVHDPDDNEIELYVDTSDAWRNGAT
jgi:catechol-2,3-dioxygenase